MSKPQTSRVFRAADPPAAAAPLPAERSGEAERASSATGQFSAFEAAMRLFHVRNFKQARDLFLEAAKGPERDVANRAQLHYTMCERRLQQATPNLRTAEDYYNYGVALINSRNIPEARANLERALEIAPASDHIHYALALAQALGGDLANAHENLRRAIELEPRNRVLARQDADFAPLAGQPPFDALIYPEKKNW